MTRVYNKRSVNLGARGFTLIEILLALTIFALIASAISGVLSGALRMDKKVKDSHVRYQDIRLAFDFLSRNLENAIAYPLDKFLPKDKAFSGKEDRISFLVPTDNGVIQIEYLVGMPGLGITKKTTVRHVKTVREIFEPSRSLEKNQFLLRRQVRLNDLLALSEVEAEEEILGENFQPGDLKLSYGRFEQSSGEDKKLVFEKDWQANDLPDAIRIDLFFREPGHPESILHLTRDVFPVVKKARL